MKSPFKFLDPFTLSDREMFFGRDKETKELYKLVFKTPLLLVYGVSGTGKTSLIQCGLASQFDGPDWLPLWIRRQTNLNESLASALKRVLPTAEGEIQNQIAQLYQHYLRPVFLIFDQFEELFILGKPEERDQFVTTLKAILDDELPCTILLVMREEYLGQLYPFEKAVPNLFDFRMRVEPMDTANVKTVLRDSFQKFNISIGNPPQEERLDDIIQNVSLGRSGIELPYLQVYLDLLYREDFARTHSNQNAIEGNNWPKLEFTQEEIRDFGTIENVLEKFLKEQQERILAQLMKQDPGISESTVKLVLDGFVTDEGTKRPIAYKRQNEWVVLDDSQQQYFPKISTHLLSSCLKELETAKILRSDDDSIELAHDSLAQIVDKHRTDEERQRNDIKRQIRSSKATFSKTGEYLTRKQLSMFEDILPLLNLEQNELDFFRDSKHFRENEYQQELKKERTRANKARNLAMLALAGLVLSLVAMGWAFIKQNEANEERIKAEAEQAKNKRIVEAFYFYDDSLALSVKQEISGEYKYGYINKEGEVLIDYYYDEATSFNQYDGFARVKRNNIKFLLDTKGKEYPLAEAINEISGTITALDLHGQQLDSIPSIIFQNPQLQVVLLYENQLVFVPTQIEDLKSLQILDLSLNVNIKGLPKEIGELKSLQILNVSRCKNFNELPERIGALKNLQTLSLNENENLKELPKTIWNLKNLQTLSLSAITLGVVPKGIGKLKSLQTLHLSGNENLKELPKEIGELENLQTLDLRGTSLDVIPKEIWELKSLHVLYLSGSTLSSIPKEIGALKSLRILYLSGNTNLKALPKEIGELQSLKTLYLDGTSLNSLPKEIGKLKNLQTLSLSENVNLKELPKEIGELKSLQTLNLNGNSNLEELPKEIGELQSLQTLDLMGNGNLKELPKEMWELKSLQTMDLRETALGGIPKEIGQLQSLQTLYLGGRFLSFIPKQIGELQILKTLDLSKGENIKELPKEIGKLQSLQTLSLSGTALGVIPKEIGSLTNLESLYFIQNRNLKALPKEIGELEYLQKLYLSGNENLKELPKEIWEIKSLETLDLEGIPLPTIPKEVKALKILLSLSLRESKNLKELSKEIGELQSLQTLDLSGSENLKELPKEIGELKSLQTLDLSRSENLKELPKEIGGLQNLQTLNLYFSKNLKALPEEIGALTSLQTLNLRGCPISEEEKKKIKSWLPHCKIEF